MPISDYLSSNIIICICFLISPILECQGRITKYFRWIFAFLVQMKTFKSAFEINRPLIKIIVSGDPKEANVIFQINGSILISLLYFFTLLMSDHVSNVWTASRRHKRHVWTGRFRNTAICIFKSKRTMYNSFFVMFNM